MMGMDSDSHVIPDIEYSGSKFNRGSTLCRTPFPEIVYQTEEIEEIILLSQKCVVVRLQSFRCTRATRLVRLQVWPLNLHYILYLKYSYLVAFDLERDEDIKMCPNSVDLGINSEKAPRNLQRVQMWSKVCLIFVNLFHCDMASVWILGGISFIRGI